jgi:hypothetical protein
MWCLMNQEPYERKAFTYGSEWEAFYIKKKIDVDPHKWPWKINCCTFNAYSISSWLGWFYGLIWTSRFWPFWPCVKSDVETRYVCYGATSLRPSFLERNLSLFCKKDNYLRMRWNSSQMFVICPVNLGYSGRIEEIQQRFRVTCYGLSCDVFKFDNAETY